MHIAAADTNISLRLSGLAKMANLNCSTVKIPTCQEAEALKVS